MLKVQGLRKTFVAGKEGVKAIAGVDFEVKPGELFTLLGPSGCGKSTVLRCLAGLEQPEAGEISIGEDVVFSAEHGQFVPAERRDVAMVFQSYAIWPHMTVFGNVVYPLEGKMSKSMAREKVVSILQLVGMGDLIDRPAPQLSGGQQQRVALARALVKGAKLLLLDEPLSNLDAKMRIEMRFELKDLQRRTGITTIFVTHDQEEAIALSDRIAVMFRGRILEIGTPTTIYQRPQTLFTAEFMGACNLLSCSVLAMGESTGFVETALGKIRCTVHAQAREGAIFTIRPEHITVSKEPVFSQEGSNLFQGTVVSAMFLGKFFDCLMEVNSEQLRVQVPSSQHIAKEEKVYLYLPPELCYAMPKG